MTTNQDNVTVSAKQDTEARILELAEKAQKWLGREAWRPWTQAVSLFYSDYDEPTELIAALSPSTVKAMARVVEAARVLVENGTNQHRCDVRCDEWTGDQNWTPCVGERFRAALAALDAEGEKLDV